MRPWRAVLLFPAFPGASAEALRPGAALLAPGPPLLLFLLLVARGCGAADAGVAAAGLLLLVLGLGAGGTIASAAVRRILPGAPRRGLHVHLVFAAWAVTLLVLALFVTGSALGSGLALLVWGIVAGTLVLRGRADVEPGRALVASCAGATGAVLALFLVAYVVHGSLVMAMPAPRSGGGTFLVRRGEAPEPGALVLARDPASARLFLARRGSGGLVPEGEPPSGPPGGWAPVGRVFFFFGVGARWGRAIP